jgi:hypothetical protein
MCKFVLFLYTALSFLNIEIQTISATTGGAGAPSGGGSAGHRAPLLRGGSTGVTVIRDAIDKRKTHASYYQEHQKLKEKYPEYNPELLKEFSRQNKREFWGTLTKNDAVSSAVAQKFCFTLSSSDTYGFDGDNTTAHKSRSTAADPKMCLFYKIVKPAGIARGAKIKGVLIHAYGGNVHVLEPGRQHYDALAAQGYVVINVAPRGAEDPAFGGSFKKVLGLNSDGLLSTARDIISLANALRDERSNLPIAIDESTPIVFIGGSLGGTLGSYVAHFVSQDKDASGDVKNSVNGVISEIPYLSFETDVLTKTQAGESRDVRAPGGWMYDAFHGEYDTKSDSFLNKFSPSRLITSLDIPVLFSIGIIDDNVDPQQTVDLIGKLEKNDIRKNAFLLIKNSAGHEVIASVAEINKFFDMVSIRMKTNLYVRSLVRDGKSADDVRHEYIEPAEMTALQAEYGAHYLTTLRHYMHPNLAFTSPIAYYISEQLISGMKRQQIEDEVKDSLDYLSCRFDGSGACPITRRTFPRTLARAIFATAHLQNQIYDFIKGNIDSDGNRLSRGSYRSQNHDELVLDMQRLFRSDYIIDIFSTAVSDLEATRFKDLSLQYGYQKIGPAPDYRWTVLQKDVDLDTFNNLYNHYLPKIVKFGASYTHEKIQEEISRQINLIFESIYNDNWILTPSPHFFNNQPFSSHEMSALNGSHIPLISPIIMDKGVNTIDLKVIAQQHYLELVRRFTEVDKKPGVGFAIFPSFVDEVSREKLIDPGKEYPVDYIRRISRPGMFAFAYALLNSNWSTEYRFDSSGNDPRLLEMLDALQIVARRDATLKRDEADIRAALEREARAEAERVATLEREAQARAEAERVAALEREAQARAEAERVAALEREAQARAEVERIAAIEREAREKEEAERIALDRRKAEILEKADYFDRMSMQMMHQSGDDDRVMYLGSIIESAVRRGVKENNLSAIRDRYNKVKTSELFTTHPVAQEFKEFLRAYYGIE